MKNNKNHFVGIFIALLLIFTFTVGSGVVVAMPTNIKTSETENENPSADIDDYISIDNDRKTIIISERVPSFDAIAKLVNGTRVVYISIIKKEIEERIPVTFTAVQYGGSPAEAK